MTSNTSPELTIILSVEDAKLLVDKIQTLEQAIRDIIDILSASEIDDFTASDMLKTLSTHDLKDWLSRKVSEAKG